MSDPQLEALALLCRECQSILETLDNQQHHLAMGLARNRINPIDYQGQQSTIVANRLQALQMLANLVGNPERHRKTLWELILAEEEAVQAPTQLDAIIDDLNLTPAHLEEMLIVDPDDEPEARTEEPRNPMWEP